MKIKWYGHAAFRLTPEDGPTVITDPYTPEEIGYAPIGETADLVIVSSDDDSAHCRADLIAGNPAVLNALTVAVSGGKAEAAGLAVSAVEAAEWDHHPTHEVPGQNGMYRFELDGISVAHMGDVGNPLTEAQASFFEGVDVLLALAGGYLTIELPDLMDVIRRAKPKIIIPMHFRTLTYKPRNTMWIQSFLDHFDDDQVDFACHYETEIKKETLPQDTRVLVLDHVR
ncbi:MAG: MBL fold metallo-hydrolase [Pseudomonadota bacterium]